MEEKLYSIGEFSKINSVKRQTLLWYDKIDLFKPVKITENGYRYYSQEQLELFIVIRNLKDLGIPLEQIKDIINTRTPEEMILIFEKQIENIDITINKLSRLKDSLCNWNQMIKKIESLPFNTVFIEYQEEERLYVTNNLSYLSDEERMLEMTKINRYRSQSSQLAENLGGIVTHNNFLNNKTVYDFYYLPALEGEHNYIKSSGYYLSTYSKGNYTETYKIYDKLKQYALDNNLFLSNKTYEQSQVGELVSASVDRYVNKISIKIIEKPCQ
ncbi:hypothetical protein BG261_01860 [Floricoccus tropicus]|uniref:HTH merR-type domain-containing protein n=1 Tax=Floricoccus tropicus TaxID=1859473 RepID=A0A1E8GM92_9LACT|nr:MerR family transcriptional regulator [Floricoccus tropicus]OFI49352.1 hypothetical protein BG261_01860 [Floricoccus tropicus]